MIIKVANELSLYKLTTKKLMIIKGTTVSLHKF